VSDNAWVFDNAWVSDNATVYDNATVSGDAMVSKTPPKVSRSDGYDFIVVPCADNQYRVITGCRYFTFEEAYKHWNKNHPKYDETMNILKFLKLEVKRLYK
jgi:hypothetical protein